MLIYKYQWMHIAIVHDKIELAGFCAEKFFCPLQKMFSICLCAVAQLRREAIQRFARV